MPAALHFGHWLDRPKQTMNDPGRLLEHAQKLAIPFRTTLGYPWAIVPYASGHHRAFPVSSHGFRFWLKCSFQNEHSIDPGPGAIEDAVQKFNTIAQSSGLVEGDVAARIRARGQCQSPEAIVVNLANRHHEALEITAHGHAFINSDPAQFIDASWSLPLNRPNSNNVKLRDHIKSILNLDGVALDRAVIWLHAALRPAPPYPILIVSGPPSSGKTILLQTLRYLIDPSEFPVQEQPESEHVLFSQALHNSVLAFDPHEAMSQSVLHRLGQLASGSALGPDDAIAPAIGRPILLSSPVPPRDFIQNAISIQLPEMNPESIRSERELASSYEAAAPAILGTLCDAASAALANMQSTAVNANSRLAAVHNWTLAASGVLGLNHDQIACALADIRIVDALRALLDKQPEWSGATTELTRWLADAGYRASDPELTVQLNSAGLRKYGISLDQIDMGTERVLRLTRATPLTARRQKYRDRSMA